LAGSLPKEVLAHMAEERRLMQESFASSDPKSESRYKVLARRHFAMLERWLDKPKAGPTWLADVRIASVVAEALQFRDARNYRLDAYSIMPNHVHAVFAPLATQNQPQSLSSIMHSLKRNTARRANQVIHRSGPFWEHESFDHYIRNQTEFNRIIKYVLENPVKAGLVKSWRDWRWNYVRSSLATPDAN
jgi:REP element-mobilizing transposase RayT